HVEFLKFVDLPRLAGASFELALAGVDPASEALLNGHGWRVADGYALSRDIEPYRDFIRDSRGEFTVAKDQNVRLRSGWFSDRSACYLAAGLPVITQDTAFGSVVPTGRGLYAFRTMEDILAALDAIEADYEANRAAARDIADAYFDACGVVERMLRQAGL
ncbi:MAG TPA: hypothetical protein VKT77_23295, partial [Chthonomonadaceae bacterium]|nr:hypothetical protein [Chthonomonadaceae bacterium]